MGSRDETRGAGASAVGEGFSSRPVGEDDHDGAYRTAVPSREAEFPIR